MQTSTPIIDIHVHSTLKPYGNSFYSNTNSSVFTDISCIWRSDKYTEIDKLLENTLGIPRYRQSDFSSLTEGQIKIACLALYPIEKGFFQLKGGLLKPFEDQIAQFASLLGKERINFVQSNNYNYFEDLQKEYKYIESLNEKPTVGGSSLYKIIKNASELNAPFNLLIIPTIEGCHALCDGTDTLNLTNWANIESNVETIKKWDSPPLFVTFAHHFYNGLCTHAKSLFDASGKLLDQNFGMRDYNIPGNDNLIPISPVGKKLIELLLEKKNGRRILIDVKHMSLEARNEYYSILENEYKEENIPVVWSHGALNTKEPYQVNLNYNDVELIYRSKGIIGIEIDQRILGYNNNRFSKWFKNIFRSQEKQSYEEASYVFNQIIKIAEHAFKNKLSDHPWQCICIGSDYDGVINPLNSYRDATSLSALYQNLILYMNKYWENKSSVIPKNHLGIHAEDVIYSIMYKNAYDFILKNYSI